MAKKRWSDKDLEVALKANITISGTLRALGLSTSPGNHKSIKSALKRLNLDTSHLRGKAHGMSPGLRKPLEQVLVENSTHSNTVSLKKRLLKEGLLRNQCEKCGIGPSWDGSELVLQLDHKNGDSFDNRLENLRLLCPNCHSQTTTFRGKSIASRYRKKVYRCSECRTPVSRKSDKCISCQGRYVESKTEWPPADELAKEVVTTSYLKVAARLGVSDNAVRKYLKRRIGFFPRKHGLVHQEGVEPSRHEDGSI